MRLILLFLVLLCSPCFAFRTLLIQDDYIYEMYEPQDRIPLSLLEEARSMYFEAYLNPRLHKDIPLKALQIDEYRFHTYEEFLSDLFQRNFASYEHPGRFSRYYYQVRSNRDQKIIGVCAVLDQNKNGRHFIEHIGVHKDFRRRGIAQTLIGEVINSLPNFVAISLDTRIFNGPAQALYEKLGFDKLETHPNPKKQFTYFHYVLRP